MGEAPPEAAGPTTRERLLQAAIGIAARQGQGAVTYRAVAAEAGVTHGLVRFYFGTRQAMLSEAFELAARRDAREAGLLSERLDDLGADFVRTISEHGERQILQYEYLISAVRGTAPLKDVGALYDFYAAQVGQTLRNIRVDDPDGSLAALVFAAFDGLVLQHAVYGDPERTERALARLRDVLRLLQGERD
ncbi:TetR family transcriptional regulator [Nonomuraea sp. MG754425]|uniref:TetR/AcrR family transcriptional regulator n=1 Tax=Nonomuraea sp. MG754425 TaxID=2570319 RepID=UPI001F0027C2|nr:TetR family transcriptional regulator [Nonomuraea sp. MG754425]MCF6469446.1 TetR family transcriptional regulator [Nonomuraea sp. MG754425]